MNRPTLLRRREIWFPTVWGWLSILVVAGASMWIFVRNVYSFLAPNERVGAEWLVVEGWLAPEELDQAVELYRAGGYARIVTTGGPMPPGFERLGFASFAHSAVDYLLRHGIPADVLTAVPAPPSAQDRTYLSCVMVREWAKQNGIAVEALDVFSAGAHARRSWLLYHKAFGSGVRIGILSARPAEYDPQHWWRSSAGTKSVLSEIISWIWTEVAFHPGAAGSHEERWGLSRLVSPAPTSSFSPRAFLPRGFQ